MIFLRRASSLDSLRAKANALGVTIQAQYTVGEYDIVILSAKKAKGWRPGSSKTAIASRGALRKCSAATSNKRCTSSSPE